MGRKHQGSPRRYIVKLFNKDCTLGLEIVHHIGVVHDFVAHVDRAAELLQRALHDFNGTVYACAKAPGFR
jgi:hypothetical protein